ncbi:MAG: hypothetical protein K5657_00940 [Desulfovibrio sp.]|nr:hypothetical protein [Desulfovibrio sp.]
MDKTSEQRIDAPSYAGVIDEKKRLLALVQKDEAARQKLYVRTLALFLYDREYRILLRLDNECLTLPFFRILDGREDPYDLVCAFVSDIFADEHRILTRARLEEHPLARPFMLAPSWASHLTILRMRLAFNSPKPASKDFLWLDEHEYRVLLAQGFCTRDPVLADLENGLFCRETHKKSSQSS